jgi:hypothetical protein
MAVVRLIMVCALSRSGVIILVPSASAGRMPTVYNAVAMFTAAAVTASFALSNDACSCHAQGGIHFMERLTSSLFALADADSLQDCAVLLVLHKRDCTEIRPVPVSRKFQFLMQSCASIG